MKKRIFGAAALALAAVVVLAAGYGTASAAEVTPAEEFEYQVYYYGAVGIFGYTGTSKSVVIPAEIEGFPVISVSLYGLGLTEIDVSQVSFLEIFSCDSNQLISLDLTQNSELSSLFCFDNPLKTLDVSQNLDLGYLHCSNTELTSLDVSQNHILSGLNCGNTELTTIDVSHNPLLTELFCDNNSLTNLDISHNPKIEVLVCYSNQLTNLNLLYNNELWYLNCNNNNLTNLDLSHNSKLSALDCSMNFLTKTTVQGVNADSLDSYILSKYNNSVDSGVKFSPQKNDNFSDVLNSEWYAQAVFFVVNSGFFSGTSSSTFSPDTSMTRAMLATVLWRVDGSPGGYERSTFADVSADAYYSGPVAWAQVNKIVAGFPDGSFRPNDNITREQIATILYKYAQSLGKAGGALPQLPFGDSAAVSEYAVDAVRWCVSVGIISGFPDNTFRPQENATRAQVAAMMRSFAGVVR
ncbi:MAG: S-layer homology domain-containing protein [Oscillospiraceae bacterium]|jgi:hypothetical protein|nr:S-layer homology domain-containing protein [Oscillospiraceae bacterium]